MFVKILSHKQKNKMTNLYKKRCSKVRTHLKEEIKMMKILKMLQKKKKNKILDSGR